jgi:hypothetical protein
MHREIFSIKVLYKENKNDFNEISELNKSQNINPGILNQKISDESIFQAIREGLSEKTSNVLSALDSAESTSESGGDSTQNSNKTPEIPRMYDLETMTQASMMRSNDIDVGPSLKDDIKELTKEIDPIKPDSLTEDTEKEITSETKEQPSPDHEPDLSDLKKQLDQYKELKNILEQEKSELKKLIVDEISKSMEHDSDGKINPKENDIKHYIDQTVENLSNKIDTIESEKPSTNLQAEVSDIKSEVNSIKSDVENIVNNKNTEEQDPNHDPIARGASNAAFRQKVAKEMDKKRKENIEEIMKSDIDPIDTSKLPTEVAEAIKGIGSEMLREAVLLESTPRKTTPDLDRAPSTHISIEGHGKNSGASRGA